MGLMINEERLVLLFKSLCLIDAHSLQERECVQSVRSRLDGMGLEVWEDDAGAKIGGNANNLIARMPGNAQGAPKIFFSAHFDTVEPTTGLIIEERDGVFYSASDTILGADDKAGMAPIIEAVQSIIDEGVPHGEVLLLFSVAEEIGLLGAHALEIEKLGLDFGYVLDTGPPVGSFVTRTANHDKLDIVIQGKPAHSGKNPEDGVSALEVAAEAISRMRLGRIDEETTANIGLIQGGTAVNIVCPYVKMRGEARSTDVAKLDAQVDHMVQTFEEAARRRGAIVVIDHHRHYSSYNISEVAEVVKVAQRASKNCGHDPALRTTLGGSDANVYNTKGVPTIVAATGMDKIHTHDECISRKDLVATAHLVRELIVESAKG